MVGVGKELPSGSLSGIDPGGTIDPGGALPSGIIDPGGAMKGVSAAEGMKNNVAAGASSPGAESIGAGADAGAKSANPQASFNEQAAKAEEGGKQIFSNAFQRMKDDFSGEYLVKDGAGKVNAKESAKKNAYAYGKKQILQSSDARKNQVQVEESPINQAPASQAQYREAEDELNRLRSRMNV